jgi:vesicle-fusing ATPase
MQKARLLDPSFEGVSTDEILRRLTDPSIEPGFVDPRYSLVAWSRPPMGVKQLVAMIQERLREVTPSGHSLSCADFDVF